jgi:hypothetical protein
MLHMDLGSVMNDYIRPLAGEHFLYRRFCDVYQVELCLFVYLLPGTGCEIIHHDHPNLPFHQLVHNMGSCKTGSPPPP